jgi:rubrerythrin
MGIPGENAGRVVSANEFLTRVNLMGGDRFPEIDTPVGIGTDVVVVGAGNTAMDCLRVARRLSASRVRCVYRRSRAEAPARAEELGHAEQEGIEFLWLHSPIEVLVGSDGDVSGVLLERMELGEPDEHGRRRPEPTGHRMTLECDTVIVALGTNPNPVITRTTPGLELDRRGYVAADPDTQATSVPGVFAGGDIVTGGATVILAMGAGRRAAVAILDYLRPEGRPMSQEIGRASTAGARCSRCRRPLVDDDDGICCAGETIQWRCTGCAKRSEGFAMPYGRCPACGGLLEAVAGAVALDDPAREAVRRALEIELGGRNFYVAAAAEAERGDMRELFARLAEMEAEHLETLVRRYHLAAPEVATGDLRAGLHQIGRDRHPENPFDLLEMSIALEQRAEAFFEEHADDAGSPVATELYRELAAEEAEHVDLLTTELAAMRRGVLGLLGRGAG